MAARQAYQLRRARASDAVSGVPVSARVEPRSVVSRFVPRPLLRDPEQGHRVLEYQDIARLQGKGPTRADPKAA
jgi:hypothetical protein